MDDAPAMSRWERITPYVIVGVLSVAQGALVAFLVKVVAPWLGAPGWLVAWVAFVIGGFALGVRHLIVVHEGEVFTDPIPRFCCWSQRRLHAAGFVINTLLLGSMGASIALKREGYPHRGVLSFVAALLYASVWIPLYLTVPFLR